MSTEKKSRERDTKKEKSRRRRSKTNRICKEVMMNFLKKLYFFFRVYFDMLIDFVYSIFWNETHQAIPDLDQKHAMLKESAVTLAEKIRNKELKSEVLVKACIERIKLVNPMLNAVTDERYADAIIEAQAVDKLIEEGISEEELKKKPFLGVPFTAKESHAVKGMLHTLGVASRRSVRAAEDAECVRLLRAAGAIPVAVTNVPEINKWQETRNMVFGQTNNPYHTGRTAGGSSGGEAALAASLASPISLCEQETRNMVFGQTNNPYHTGRTAGGSSGGEAALAASLASPISLCSDIGGSTRMPAFFCGLYALNPTAEHTSMKGSTLRSGKEPTMASIGFVSKHCEDLIPLTKIVADEKAHLLDLDRPVNVKDLKFYYVESIDDLRVSPIGSDLKKAMKRVVHKLSAGAESTEGAPKPYHHEGFNHSFALWRHAMTKEADCFAELLTDNQGEATGLVELAKKLVGRSEFTLAAIMKLLDDQVLPAVPAAWAEDLTKQLKDDLIETLGSDAVLLFPSAPSPATYHYVSYLRPFNFALWGIFNALKFPAAQVPLGLNSDGLPLGIQVVATPQNDALSVAVADHIGKLFQGYVPPCRVPE